MKTQDREACNVFSCIIPWQIQGKQAHLLLCCESAVSLVTPATLLRFCDSFPGMNPRKTMIGKSGEPRAQRDGWCNWFSHCPCTVVQLSVTAQGTRGWRNTAWPAPVLPPPRQSCEVYEALRTKPRWAHDQPFAPLMVSTWSTAQSFIFCFCR